MSDDLTEALSQLHLMTAGMRDVSEQIIEIAEDLSVAIAAGKLTDEQKEHIKFINCYIKSTQNTLEYEL